MSASEDVTEQPWSPPPTSECDVFEDTMTLEGADPTVDRVALRLLNHGPTFDLVDFALVQQTHYGGKWRDVAMVDSAHDDEVHVHRYGKVGGESEHKERLRPIACAADVQDGYSDAYQAIFEKWAQNKERWQHG